MVGLIRLIELASTVLSLLVIARVVLSWTGLDERNAAVALIYRVTEPIMAPVRRLLPSAGGMDFSPMLVLVGIWIVERVLIRLLISL